MAVYETVVEYLPEFAAAAGLFGGSALGAVAYRREGAQRQQLAESWGPDVVGYEDPSHSRVFSYAALGVLAGYCAVTAAFNATAWQPSAGNKTTPAHIEVVVDHSGATQLATANHLPQINKIAETFNDPSIDVTATVGSAGLARVVPINDVAQDPAFGDAPMGQATQTALGNEGIVRQGSIDPTRESIGTLIITNGNSVGDPAQITNQARNVGTKIFIANVDAAHTDTKTAQDLQAIAQQTKGQYWDAANMDPGKIADAVKDGLSNNENNDKDQSNKWANRILGGVMLGFIPFYFRRRVQESLTPNGTKVGE